MYNDGSGTVHLSDIYNLAAIGVHSIDWTVSAVSPVNFVVDPIKSNPFGIYFITACQNVFYVWCNRVFAEIILEFIIMVKKKIDKLVQI